VLTFPSRSLRRLTVHLVFFPLLELLMRDTLQLESLQAVKTS